MALDLMRTEPALARLFADRLGATPQASGQ
jgi:hypothetical protein